MLTAPGRPPATRTTSTCPEPIAKGKTLTVTGKLSRADWGYVDVR
ncbi:hypothetical protein OG866_20770 [Streptomyces sp. NBC_00663]|nr:hypothetical protein [Streptomyces sp. NBC_00663]